MWVYLVKGGGAATHFKDATQIRVQHASAGTVCTSTLVEGLMDLLKICAKLKINSDKMQ